MKLRIALTLLFAIFMRGVSAQTETEPSNNTPAGADNVPVNSCINVTLNASGDVDYFKVIVPRGGVLVVRTENIPGNRRPELKLYLPGNFTYTPAGGSASMKGENALMEALVEPGTYYVKLTNFNQINDTTPYFQLCFDLDSVDGSEVNNSFSKAVVKSPDTCFQAKLRGYNSSLPNNYDIDFYKITTPKDGVFTVNIQDVPNNLQPILTIYADDETSMLAEKAATSKGGNVKLELLLEAGSYYAVIEDGSNKTDSNAYQVCFALDMADVFEYNNIVSKAKAIQLDSCITAKIYGAYLLNGSLAGDQDIYSFQTTEDGELTVNLSQVPAILEMQVAIYDSAITLIGTKTGLTGQAVSLTQNLNKGNYYLVIRDDLQNEISPDIYKACLNFEKQGGTSSIGNESKAQGVTVYPNPSSGEFYINTGKETPVNIEITNAAGQVIFNEMVSDNEPVKLDVQTGIYFLRIADGEKISTIKMSVVK